MLYLQLGITLSRRFHQMLRVGVVQFSPQIGKVHENIAKVRKLCARFTPNSLDLLCLSEMVLTGYVFPNAAAIAPYLEHPHNGPTARFCAELATHLRCYVVAGYPERLHDADTNDDVNNHNPGIGANSALLYGPDGSCIANYRKSNLYETDMTWAKAGTGFRTLSLPLPLGNVTLGICMDLNPFPPNDWKGIDEPYELVNHALSSSTDTLVLLNAWLDSGHEPEADHDWSTLNYWAGRLRPLWDTNAEGEKPSKQTLVIICNRTGHENGTTFAGTSAVFRLTRGSGDPELVHTMGRHEEGVRLWHL